MFKKLLFSPLFAFFAFAFIVTSWPFIYYPLTDGDIIHWVKIAQDVQLHHHFLTGAHDQAHGPLLSWTAGVLSILNPGSFYLLASFNILCGLVGLGLIYFFAHKLWNTPALSRLAAFIFSTSLVYVYLSRTPMYDWPAAVFYFGFCGFFSLYLLESRPTYLYLAWVQVGISSLSRFSISIGLSLFFIGIAFLLFFKAKKLPFKSLLLKVSLHSLCVILVCFLVNLPWLWGHYTTLGPAFIHDFLYDNMGRYIKEPGDSVIHRDYYGFLAYTLIGVLPYTMGLLAALFQKSVWIRLRQNLPSQLLCAAFVPCLLFFSFSGHVKLARYIAYVFPPLLLLFSYHLFFELKNPKFIQLAKRMTWGLCGILFCLLLSQAYQFNQEASESLPLVGGCVGLLFGLIALAYRALLIKTDTVLSRPETLLWPFAAIFMVFFSILTYESLHASFLLSIRQDLLRLFFN